MWVRVIWLCLTYRQTEFPGRRYELFDKWAETHSAATDDERMIAWKELVTN